MESFPRCLVSEGPGVVQDSQHECVLNTVAFLGNPPCALGSACHICLPTVTATADNRSAPVGRPFHQGLHWLKNDNLKDFSVSLLASSPGLEKGCLLKNNLVFSLSKLICLLKTVSCYTPNRDHNSL